MKTALLKLFSLQTLLLWISRLLYGITEAQWASALRSVREAARRFTEPGSGTEKKAYAHELLDRLYLGMTNRAKDFLIQSALGYLEKQGEKL
jgi:hypothetical protein